MKNVIVHHDSNWLLKEANGKIAVQAYKGDAFKKEGISRVGSPLITAIRRFGVLISPVAMDFLTIALGVTAADTFVNRSEAADKWTRRINLKIALQEPKRWELVKQSLENAFHFLSGDIWHLEFVSGGYAAPVPMKKIGRAKLIEVNDLDCVSLFSGGLDSAVGAIDLLHSGRNPLLVSHSYRGDKQAQGNISTFLRGHIARFSTSIYPLWGGEKGSTV